MIRAECLYCRCDMGPRPGVPWVENGVIFDKTHDVCERCKPMVELQIEQVQKELKIDVTQPDTMPQYNPEEERKEVAQNIKEVQ